MRFAAFPLLALVCGCGSQPPVEVGNDSHAAWTATIVAYERNAGWDHSEDGVFATYDRLRLNVDSDQSFTVDVPPTTFSDTSPFRVPGTRFTFTLSEPPKANTHLAWAAINDPTLIE